MYINTYMCVCVGIRNQGYITRNITISWKMIFPVPAKYRYTYISRLSLNCSINEWDKYHVKMFYVVDKNKGQPVLRFFSDHVKNIQFPDVKLFCKHRNATFTLCKL